MYALIIIIVLFMIFYYDSYENYANITYGFGDLLPQTDQPFFYPTFNVIKADYQLQNNKNKIEEIIYLPNSIYKQKSQTLCDISRRGVCGNNKCIYKSLDECQFKCKNECIKCSQRTNMYKCVNTQ